MTTTRDSRHRGRRRRRPRRRRPSSACCSCWSPDLAAAVVGIAGGAIPTFAAGVYLLVVSAAQPDGGHEDAASFVMFLSGGLLVSQSAAAAAFLFLPAAFSAKADASTSSTATTATRSACLCQVAQGFALVAASLWSGLPVFDGEGGTGSGEGTGGSSSAWTPLPLVVLAAGTLSILSCCLALMLTFWPASSSPSSSGSDDDDSVGDIGDDGNENGTAPPGSELRRLQPQPPTTSTLLLEPLLSRAATEPSSSHGEEGEDEDGAVVAAVADADGGAARGEDRDRGEDGLQAAAGAEPNDNADGSGVDANGSGGSGGSGANGRLRGTRRLLQLAKSQTSYLYAGCAALLVRLPFSLVIPHLVSTALSLLHASRYDDALRQVLYLFLAGTVDAGLDFWCVFLFGYAQNRIVKSLRVDLFRHLLRQEVAFYDLTSSGELASRIQSDCSEMSGDLTWFFRFSIESVVRIAGISTYMMLRSPALGACALGIAPLVGAINKWYGTWLARNAVQVQDALAAANAVAQEALANVRTVVSFAAEETESRKYERKIETQYRLSVRQLYMTGVYYMAVSTFLINTVVQALLLYIGTRMIQHGRLTADILLAFMLYQGQLQNETLNLFQSYSSLIKSSGAGDKVFALLDRKPPPPSINNPTVRATAAAAQQQDDDATASDAGEFSGAEASDGALVPTGSGERSNELSTPSMRRPDYNVRFKQVCFSYPSRPNHLVLDHLDLEIPSGRTVALVGTSGCGKSTIVHLLQRFYDPDSGVITVDGVDLKQLDILEHRRHTGVVTQEPVLFSGSIFENITFGYPRRQDGISDDLDDQQEEDQEGGGPSTSSSSRRVMDEVMRAAKLAHADEFISSKCGSYLTSVGEGGVQLSGGQKQRIAISRALIKEPALLLLDEATSALDAESEQAVQTALDQLFEAAAESHKSDRRKKMTTVIVAHRLRTVQKADYIAVLSQGRVAEWGSHSELMQRRAPAQTTLYRKMVERAGTSGILPEKGE